MFDDNNSRRTLMKTATLGAAEIVVASKAANYAKLRGANDRVR
jgi:hypothetical protein